MSNQSSPVSSPNVSLVLTGLAFGTFVQCSVHPGWTSVIGFLGVLGALGYITFLNPMRKLEVQRGEFEKLEERVALLQEQLTATRVKIGFQIPGR